MEKAGQDKTDRELVELDGGNNHDRSIHELLFEESLHRRLCADVVRLRPHALVTHRPALEHELLDAQVAQLAEDTARAACERFEWRRCNSSRRA